jgi:hypothetical protein
MTTIEKRKQIIADHLPKTYIPQNFYPDKESTYFDMDIWVTEPLTHTAALQYIENATPEELEKQNLNKQPPKKFDKTMIPFYWLSTTEKIILTVGILSWIYYFFFSRR